MGSIPKFNDKGYVPEGCHETTLDEFKKRFVDGFKESNTRISRFEGFLKYSDYLRLAINHEIKYLLNGSFTTTEINPNDIDFLIVFDLSKMRSEEYCFAQEEYNKQYEKNKIRGVDLEKFKLGLMPIEEVYCCDWYPLYKRNSSEGELYEDYLNDKNYWIDLFSQSKEDTDGNKHSKGIITFKI